MLKLDNVGGNYYAK